MSAQQCPFDESPRHLSSSDTKGAGEMSLENEGLGCTSDNNMDSGGFDWSNTGAHIDMDEVWAGADAISILDADERAFQLEQCTGRELGDDIRVDPSLLQTPCHDEASASRLAAMGESPSEYFGRLSGTSLHDRLCFFSPGNENNRLLVTPKNKRPFTFLPDKSLDVDAITSPSPFDKPRRPIHLVHNQPNLSQERSIDVDMDRSTN